MQTDVGDGATTLFWTERWLLGQRIMDIAPRLFASIPKRKANKRTVLEALTNRSWISDIQGALSVGALVDYVNLWDMLDSVELQPGTEDRHFFRLSANGKYSAKAAYEGFFCGSILFESFERIWKTWAPPKCNFFMWLVAHNKCWTADRLARRGLPHHERFLLCDQEAETIDHLLLTCPFSKEFWFRFLSQVNLQVLSPQLEDHNFILWWKRASEATEGISRLGFNSLVILGVWILWKVRNGCVF